MKWLLDTHAFLWLITGDDRLSTRAKTIFLDQGNSLFFSAACMWELCIKVSLGKLTLKSGWRKVISDEMETNVIHWLPIEKQHCTELTNLPFHHRDPFDRMLIAQAKVESMTLLSRDRQLSAYGIMRVW